LNLKRIIVVNPLPLALSVAVFSSLPTSSEQISAQPHSSDLRWSVAPISILAKAPVDPSTGYPIVDGKNWDRQGPWFQPVLVQDSAGNYVAVLDKQKQGALRTPKLTTIDQLGVFSNWSRQGIKLVGNTQVQLCVWALCSTNYPRIAVEDMEVKLGDQVFRPKRKSDTFLMDEELAQALQTATPGKALLRLHLKSGVTITRAISNETVQAWPKVFQAASTGAVPDVAPIGGGNLSTAKIVSVEPFPALPPDATSKSIINDPKTGLPLINGATWRTGRNVALAKPVVVRDEFDGEYKAVISKKEGIVSQWSRNFVDVFISSRFVTVLSFRGIPSLHITYGNRTLNLYGKNNRFEINKMAAQFLQEAGEKSINELPTMTFYVGKDNKRTYEVDIGTVKSWASLYRES
jgi:hypothetical protein